MLYGTVAAVIILSLLGLSVYEHAQAQRREERRLKRKKWRKWYRSTLRRKSIGRNFCRRLFR